MADDVFTNGGKRHSCKAKGVLASHQGAEVGLSGAWKRNKPGIRSLLRGFRASRWTRSGQLIA
jgi:hypothetical protein